jgi:hypothetical protein
VLYVDFGDLLEKLLVRVCELVPSVRPLSLRNLLSTHLLSLCSCFSGGPGIHEKRHLCVETGVLSPSSNTARGRTIGLRRSW